MEKELRLDKLLSDSGLWSRKEAKQLLKQGRVQVDGTVERAPERKVRPDQGPGDRGRSAGGLVGIPLYYDEQARRGAHCHRGPASKDGAGPAAPEYQNLFPVGRLDKDTEGLLLLTDDGALAHRLLSPGTM